MWYENFDCHIFFWHRSSYGCNSLGFITARLFSIFLLCTFEFLWWPAFKQLMHGILNVSAGTSELGGLKFFLQQKKNSDFFCVENSVRFAIYKNKGFLFFFLFHLDKNYIMLITNEMDLKHWIPTLLQRIHKVDKPMKFHDPPVWPRFKRWLPNKNACNSVGTSCGQTAYMYVKSTSQLMNARSFLLCKY